MASSINRILLTVSLILSAVLPAITHGKSVILPVEAIEDSATMSAEEFESTHPGIDISGYIPDEEGYYIKYSHENLNYYFGPVDTYLEAVLWKDKLAAIVEDVISVRLTLQNSELEIYHFDHEMLQAAQAEMERRQEEGEGTWVKGTTNASSQAQGDQGGAEQGSLDQRGILDQQDSSGQSKGENQGKAIGGSDQEIVFVEETSGQQGSESGLFGKTAEEMSRMAEQQGQESGQQGQLGQQGSQQGSRQGQRAIQVGQRGGQQGQRQGQQTMTGRQQSQSGQQGQRSSQSSRSQSSRSSQSSSSSSSSSSSGGPSMPSSGQPASRSLNWWEMLRSIFGG